MQQLLVDPVCRQRARRVGVFGAGWTPSPLHAVRCRRDPAGRVFGRVGRRVASIGALGPDADEFLATLRATRDDGAGRRLLVLCRACHRRYDEEHKDVPFREGSAALTP